MSFAEDNIENVWFAIVNPSAGSGKTLAQWREAEGYLYDRNIRYKFVTPESSKDADMRIKAACRAGYRHFIAVGGDGTVHNTLCSICEYVRDCQAANHSIDGSGCGNGPLRLDDFTLVVLPIGSGNDWLRSHNIPKDHKVIVDLIAAGNFRKQDVARVEVVDPVSGKVLGTRYMANIGGYNFDANVCDVVNFQKANGVTGKLLYINALRSIAFAQKPYRTKIVCDGKTVFDDLLYTISIGNGMYSGGGLCQTPSAVIDDGLLNLMVAPKFAIWRVFFNIRKLLDKRVEQIKFLRFFTASSIDIIPEGQGQLVEVDGEIVGRAPVHIEVLEEKISVLHLE